jgi:hypothetical protein
MPLASRAAWPSPPAMTHRPWTFFMVAVAGWMNRQQAEAIEYLRMENRILREKLGHNALRALCTRRSSKRAPGGFI